MQSSKMQLAGTVVASLVASYPSSQMNSTDQQGVCKP